MYLPPGNYRRVKISLFKKLCVYAFVDRWKILWSLFCILVLMALSC